MWRTNVRFGELYIELVVSYDSGYWFPVLNQPIPSKRYKFACVPLEDSDQPEHKRSLIRVIYMRSMGTQASDRKLRLVRLCRYADWFVCFAICTCQFVPCI